MNKNPLTLQELQEMAGRPVYCPEIESYGIILCEAIGEWAGVPFFIMKVLQLNFHIISKKENLNVTYRMRTAKTHEICRRLPVPFLRQRRQRGN